jgi:hypothetical protein
VVKKEVAPKEKKLAEALEKKKIVDVELAEKEATLKEVLDNVAEL